VPERLPDEVARTIKGHVVDVEVDALIHQEPAARIAAGACVTAGLDHGHAGPLAHEVNVLADLDLRPFDEGARPDVHDVINTRRINRALNAGKGVGPENCRTATKIGQGDFITGVQHTHNGAGI